MRKFIFGIFILLLCINLALAGGIVTNTNQSAQYIRTLNRNASTSVDAAYYNPAGLTRLDDGIYFLLSNQSIFQTKEVTPEYTGLTFLEEKYIGDVQALVFPDIHVVYKMGSLAIGGSFMPIGGGGSADYSKGIPSFEVDIAGLTATLTSATGGDVTGYRMDVNFEGSSVYYGGQVGAAYAINDMISVAVGGRFVMANNTYNGHVKSIQIYSAALVGDWIAPGAYLTAIGDPLGNAAQVTALTADKVVKDAKKTGSGFTAIVGANIAPMDGLNIGFRYEHLTGLELETETDVDITGVLEDGAKENYDMPAMLALGASYLVTPTLRTEASFNYYMNTGVGWDGTTRKVDNLDNGLECGVAFEYTLSEVLMASAGVLYSKSGVKDAYQTDLDYSLNSTSVGLGVAYRLSDNLEINLGGVNTFYTEGENASGTETYNKTSLDVAIGVCYQL